MPPTRTEAIDRLNLSSVTFRVELPHPAPSRSNSASSQHDQAQVRLKKDEVTKLGAAVYVVLPHDILRTKVFKTRNTATK